MACSSVAGDRAVIHAIDIVTCLGLRRYASRAPCRKTAFGTYNLSTCLAGSMRSYSE